MAELCLPGHNPAMPISRWTEKLRRFAALDGADKWLLARAVGWLAVARVMMLAMSFSRLAARLSVSEDTTGREADPAVLSRVSWAVAAAANNVPWRSDCFPQTIAASKILRKYGHGSTIHLGVERVDDDELAGHAWLTCGEVLVTGHGVDSTRYTELHRMPPL
jgi:hypothetical protein